MSVPAVVVDDWPERASETACVEVTEPAAVVAETPLVIATNQDGAIAPAEEVAEALVSAAVTLVTAEIVPGAVVPDVPESATDTACEEVIAPAADVPETANVATVVPDTGEFADDVPDAPVRASETAIVETTAPAEVVAD